MVDEYCKEKRWDYEKQDAKCIVLLVIGLLDHSLC